MSEFSVFKWQDSLWKRWLGRIDALPHALLLAGPRGIGKSRFARALAARLLCETPRSDGFACETCNSCRWFSAGSHPDCRILIPESAEAEGRSDAESTEATESTSATKKKSDQIVIGQIRALEDFANIGTHRNGYRVVIVRPAEAMNPAAANSLLKLLEEPAPSTLFLLISDNARRLLPTIRSRCQRIDFSMPSAEEAAPWLSSEGVSNAQTLLALTGGAPLAARKLAESGGGEKSKALVADLIELAQGGSLATAGRWESLLKPEKGRDESTMDRVTLVDWMQKWVCDITAVQMGGATRYYPANHRDITAIAERARTSSLLDCYNDLLRIRAVARHPLNARLFFEDLIARYQRGVAPVKRA